MLSPWGCHRPQDTKNRGIHVRQTQAHCIQRVQETAEAIRHKTLLLRRFFWLCQISAEKAAYCRQGKYTAY